MSGKSETLGESVFHGDPSENDMPWVCSFQGLDRNKISWVGGKGANLGEMTLHGFPVPEGFCVTTAAYRALLAQANPDQCNELFDGLQQIDVENTEEVRRWGETMRSFVLSLPIPALVEDAIVTAWNDLGQNHFYAVRSSATAEDLPDASFAGQQDTYLNIRGKDELLAHVHRCWASLFTDRAIVYRVLNGFEHRDVALSVVVQRMILPEYSGILFTVDPVSENRHVLSIDASYGLGEALVSGKVSPDLYRYNKKTGEVVEIHVKDKALAIRPLPDGGTVEEAIPAEMRKTQVLQEVQIKELAELGHRIEQYYGKPQDIEWCWQGGKFFIVQSRPITSLYPDFQYPHAEDSLQVHLCFNHLQVMTDPMSPLGISCISLLLPFGKWDEPPSATTPFLNTAGGRIYINLTRALRHPRAGKGIAAFLQIADKLTAYGIRAVIEREQFQREAKAGAVISLPWLARRIVLPVFRRVFGFLSFRDTAPINAQRTDFLDQEFASIQQELRDKQGDRLGRLHRLFAYMGTFFQHKLAFNFLPVIASGVLSARLVAKLCGKTMDDPDIVALMRGYPGNVTTEMDLQLGDLADVARTYPAVVQCFREQPVSQILSLLPEVKGGKEFLDAFQIFLAKYGVRAASEIDIGRTRWKDDPTPLLQMLVGNLAVLDMGLHRKHHKKMAEQAEEARDRLIQGAGRGFWGWLRQSLVRRLTRVHRDMMGIREHPKWMLIRILGLAREIFLEEAERWVQAGDMDKKEDVFFLTWEEILAKTEGRWQEIHPEQTMRALVQLRRSNYERWVHLFPPRVLTSEGEIIRAQHQGDHAPKGALVGEAASAGVVEGTARVILSPNRAVLQHGEILVAPFTDPGWTPLFIHAAGLVMEVGGLMTHGSVIAREYGIPAVVCVPDATKIIRTGQRIRVNGSSGFVEILEEPQPISTNENPSSLSTSHGDSR